MTQEWVVQSQAGKGLVLRGEIHHVSKVQSLCCACFSRQQLLHRDQKGRLVAQMSEEEWASR